MRCRSIRANSPSKAGLHWHRIIRGSALVHKPTVHENPLGGKVEVTPFASFGCMESHPCLDSSDSCEQHSPAVCVKASSLVTKRWTQSCTSRLHIPDLEQLDT